ncbi:MAG: hypothetical protein MHM6MM_005955 [Cercozoa sp. M6MM]
MQHVQRLYRRLGSSANASSQNVIGSVCTFLYGAVLFECAYVGCTATRDFLERNVISFKTVRGRSMLPELHDGDLIVFLRTGACDKGDMVISRKPFSSGLSVKRISHVEGDRVRNVSFNRRECSEVPSHHVLLLGTNPRHSLDSRVWGPISREFIEGRVCLRYRSSGEDGYFKKVERRVPPHAIALDAKENSRNDNNDRSEDDCNDSERHELSANARRRLAQLYRELDAALESNDDTESAGCDASNPA